MTAAGAFAHGALPGVSPEIYTEADFKAIARMVREEAGIVLPEGKSMLVFSRIAPLVRASTSSTFGEFIKTMASDHGARKTAIDALTTNHTFFFRESHHFRHFAETVRPQLLSRLDREGAARLWSAGCSSGEETWSLVLTLLGEDAAEGRRLIKRDLRVLASDLSHRVLRKAESARYPLSETKDVPPVLRKNWLTTAGDEVAVGVDARSLVRFRELNLLGEWPMRQPFDVIFCRNVMIYFDQPTKDRLVERFAQMLRPGGFLYIGHSERIAGPATRLFDLVGPTIYQRGH